MNIAVITAAGTGTRTKQIVPKQFLNVNDKPIIIYTLECFQRHPEVDAIYVACLAGWEGFMDLYSKQFHITKLRGIVQGGATGQESIEKVLAVVEKECSPDDLVMIHDGSRPYVPEKVISDSIRVCREHGNAVAAIDTKEAMLQTEDKIQSTVSIECGYRVWFSKGSDLNFKITSEEDLMIFRALVAVMDKLNLTEDEA